MHRDATGMLVCVVEGLVQAVIQSLLSVASLYLVQYLTSRTPEASASPVKNTCMAQETPGHQQVPASPLHKHGRRLKLILLHFSIGFFLCCKWENHQGNAL